MKVDFSAAARQRPESTAKAGDDLHVVNAAHRRIKSKIRRWELQALPRATSTIRFRNHHRTK